MTYWRRIHVQRVGCEGFEVVRVPFWGARREAVRVSLEFGVVVVFVVA